MPAVIADHGGEGFAVGEFAGAGVIFHGGDQRDARVGEELERLGVVVTLVGFEVGDVLQPGLDSLRHEQGLLFGSFERGEELAQALAVPVVGDGEADPAAGVAAIDGHTGRAEFGDCGGFAVFAALGGRGFEGR